MKSFDLFALPLIRSRSCGGTAPDRVGGGGASRVAASGPRAATESPVGERRGPTPARLHPSRVLPARGVLGAPAQPTEPATSLWHRHVPHAGLLALEVVSPATLVGLVHRLPADAECVRDLRPGSPVAARRTGQQISYVCQRFLGVSHVPEGLQRPLRAAQGVRQVLHHPSRPHPRVGAFFRAHVNGYWQRPRTAIDVISSIPIDHPGPANCGKHSISRKEVSGAPSGDISPPGDYVRPRDSISGSTQPKKETPQERQLLGVVDDIRGN